MTSAIATTLYSLEWLKDHGPRIALLLALAVVVSVIGRLAVARFRRRLEAAAQGGAQISLYRTATLVGTAYSAIRIVLWTVVVLMILGELGFDLGPLLAGAGVAGIAVGFGAQSLVKDFLAGFFILLEDQFGIGEQVDLAVTGGTVSGRVESMSLRATSVRAADGTLSVVPNGNIMLASNRSRGLRPEPPPPAEGDPAV